MIDQAVYGLIQGLHAKQAFSISTKSGASRRAHGRSSRYTFLMENRVEGFRKEKMRRVINAKWFGITMLGGIVLVAVLGSFLVLHFEKTTNPEIKTYGDAVWLSFETMTTVGFGDKVPITPGGKVSVVLEMVIGITLLTGFIGTRATARAEEAQRRKKGLDKTTSLKGHFVVCGWNQRGKYTIDRLATAARGSGIPVVLLCGLDESPVKDDFVFFYKGSPTSLEDQKRANMQYAQSAILLADDQAGGTPGDIDARTVLAALTAHSLNPDMKITAEVLEPANAAYLTHAGVGEVFDHNLIGGNLLAQSAMRYGIIEVVTALAKKDVDAKMYRIPIDETMVGKMCGDVTADVERDQGYEVIGLRRPDGMQVCDATSILGEGDELIVLSKTVPPNADLPE
jgi:voltage-gated potassium channel